MDIHGAKFLFTKRLVTQPLVHWNYFLALESDFVALSRYIEFSQANFSAYSIEAGRLLMAATQECDVLLKQICANGAEKEEGYRKTIPGLFPNFASHRVLLPRFNLEFEPFSNWTGGSPQTPAWWTANNKFKHQRHDYFDRGTLENALNAICALLLCNIYFYHNAQQLKELQPIPQLLVAEGLMQSVEHTAVGLAPNFQL